MKIKKNEKSGSYDDKFKKDIYPLIERYFFNKGINKAKITFYKSMVRPPTRPLEPLKIETDEGLILFFETEIQFPQGGGYFPLATEENGIPAVTLELGKYFYSKGIHMAIIVNGTNEAKAKDAHNYLEGLLSLVWKNAPYYSRIISYFVIKEDDKIKTGYASPVFLNPGCSGQPPFSNSNIDFLGTIYKRIASVRKITNIQAALKWFRLAYPNYLITEQWTDAKEFILCWTALEVLCGGGKTVTKIKREFSKYYKIEKDEVEKRIGIGKLYNIRCDMLHKGSDYAIHSCQMEILRETFIIYLGILLHIHFEGLLLNKILEGKAEFMPFIFEFIERK